MESKLKQRTAKGLLWGSLGNGGFQLLNLVFGIFLARLLTPADYGVIGSLTIFSAIAGLLSESGFTLAIVNKKTVTDNDLNAVFWFNVAVSIALYALLFFLAPLIAAFYNMPEMTPLARFLFTAFVFGGLSTTPSAILFRNLKVKERSTIMLAAVTLSGTAGVVCAANGWGYWGIALQTVVYSCSTAAMLWLTCAWRPKLKFNKQSLVEMLPFSTKQLATSLFTHINNNFFSMLLAKLYGMKPAGYYTQGSKWVTMGSNTITGAINSVGQPVFREAIDENERLCRIFRKMLRFAAFVGFPAMGGLAIVSPELITITITDKWIQCVPIMQILCVSGAFMPISTLYGNLFNAINRPSVYMWSTISLGLLQLLCVIVSCRFGLTVMLIVYATVNVVWLLVWQNFARKAIGLKLKNVLSDIAPYLCGAVFVLAVAWVAASAIENNYISLLVKILVASSLYIFLLWIFKSAMLRETINYLKNRDA